MTDPVEMGFNRPMTAALPGTVKLYHRHLFICTGQSDWPKYIDSDGGFGQALSEAIAQRAPEMALKVKVTACDESSAGTGYDLLVFPDQVRYFGLQQADLPALVEDHLIGNQISGRLRHQPLSGRYLFVCTHNGRDRRCGFCGPLLIGRFRDELESHGLARAVAVLGTSHVGGHEYAGNVLVYPEGDWYGYVTPDDVPRIVEQHLLRAEIVAGHWRGRMGVSREDQVAFSARRNV